MPTVTIEEAQAKLPELIDQLLPGEEMLITRDHCTVARLVVEVPATLQQRQPGSAKGQLVILVEDNEHLEDFEDHLE